MLRHLLKSIAMITLFVTSMTAYPLCYQGREEAVIPLIDKLYVRTDQISFIEDKIYIQLENYLFETPAIYSDENGYFIDKIAKSGHCYWYEWQCTKCSTCNLRGFDWICRKCEKPISE